MRPPAFMVVDPHSRRSLYLDHARAEQQAMVQHGMLLELYPGHLVEQLQERIREVRGLLPGPGEAMPQDLHARLQVLLGEGA